MATENEILLKILKLATLREYYRKLFQALYFTVCIVANVGKIRTLSNLYLKLGQMCNTFNL